MYCVEENKTFEICLFFLVLCFFHLPVNYCKSGMTLESCCGDKFVFIYLKTKMNLIFFYLVSALLPDCSLCWDRWNDQTPTLEVALLSSSRAGADLGWMSDSRVLCFSRLRGGGSMLMSRLFVGELFELETIVKYANFLCLIMF